MRNLYFHSIVDSIQERGNMYSFSDFQERILATETFWNLEPRPAKKTDGRRETRTHYLLQFMGGGAHRARPMCLLTTSVSVCFAALLITMAPLAALQSVVFESYHIQGGTDRTGVPTKMMSVNATVRLRFRNRGTFFSLHVTATPFLLFYGDLTVASGEVRTIPAGIAL